MKLATLKDGSRDGMLAVVSRDLKTAHLADGIAPTLQRALDDWPFIGPQLEELSLALNAGRAKRPFDFVPANCMAPLPRAFQWIDGSTYAQHVELLMRARGAKLPDNLWREPRMYQGGSDDFLGPCDDAPFEEEHWDIDFEPELAVVLGDTPMHVRRDEALEHVRLILLANDWSLRAMGGAEMGRGFGFLQSKPATAFAPLAVTPDELGEAWRDGLAHLTVSVAWNGTAFTTVQSGAGTKFGFAELIAHAGRTRSLRAGSIIGSGTVSGPGGVGCIAEKRAAEALEAKEARETAARTAPAPSDAEADAAAAPVDAAGDPPTPVTTGPRTEFLRFGDRVRIEALDSHGHSMFGALDQQVVAYKRRRPVQVAAAAPLLATGGALAEAAGQEAAAGPGAESDAVAPAIDLDAGMPADGPVDALADAAIVMEANEPVAAEGAGADAVQVADEALPEAMAATDSGVHDEAGGPAETLAEAVPVPEGAEAAEAAAADDAATGESGPVATPTASDAALSGSPVEASPEEPVEPAADTSHKTDVPEDGAAPGAAHST